MQRLKALTRQNLDGLRHPHLDIGRDIDLVLAAPDLDRRLQDAARRTQVERMQCNLGHPVGTREETRDATRLCPCEVVVDSVRSGFERVKERTLDSRKQIGIEKVLDDRTTILPDCIGKIFRSAIT